MFYDADFENTYEELISYYPAFYRDVLEMRAVLEAQGRIGDNCIAGIKGVLNNCFIESADEATITRLENFLHIETDYDRSLEERRRLVYSFFVGFGKVSASAIKETIRALTGAGCTLSFKRTDEAGNSTLEIEIERGENKGISYADIDTVLSKRIPAHISYEAFVKYSINSIVTSVKRDNFLHEYKQCGLEPEVALLGSKQQAKTITETDAAAKSYTVDYIYCGTALAGTV